MAGALFMTRAAAPGKCFMNQYTLVRSARKTIAICIRPNGDVEVRAPQRTPARAIEDFVRSKAQWIAEKRSMMLERDKKRSRFALDYNSRLLVLGEEWGIRTGRTGYDLSRRQMLIPNNLNPDEIKSACERGYRKLARDFLPARIERYAARMDVTPANIRISGATTRWGSCSGKGSLNFSWRLMMAPGEVIDYVVVHELAHLREMNHSPRFWAIVTDTMPEYQVHRTALKRLQARLAEEDW